MILYPQALPSRGPAQDVRKVAEPLNASCCCRYGCNIAFNIVNKQTLNAFPMPYAIATWQLTASVLCGIVLWITKTIPRPKVTSDATMLPIQVHQR